MLPPTPALNVVARATTTTISTATSGAQEFLNLIASPLEGELTSSSIISSITFSLIFSLVLTLVFSLIRPYHNVVYAPRAKYADSKHAPPKVRSGLFGWARTIMGVREAELVEKLGLDAALFMRFIRMLRNVFSILTVIGCGLLIPTNLIESAKYASTKTTLNRLTPSYVFGNIFWIYVVTAYLFNLVICYFLWRNYRAVLALRRQYFDSPDYQRSLHSRTLLLTEIPRDLRTDDGIVRIAEQACATADVPRAAIARNVKDLPDLIEEHEQTVRDLEKVLAKYLKNPNRLPAKRPTCKAHKHDKAYSSGQRVDAIEYLTARIKELEIEVKEARENVDKRNAMPYGFASYPAIPEAHGVAYTVRNKRPQGTLIRLAPKPNDLIWKNLPMMKKARDWQNFINNLWVALLTVVYVVPNVLIAVFLTNLAHLGLLWPAFETSLEAHPVLWSLVQGILSPAITTTIYIFLPKLFRRLVTNAGDVTRTSRERHVMHKLFSFFLFNNLVVFSLFSAIFAFVAAVVKASNKADASTWQAIKDAEPFSNIVAALITVSPYWMVWLLQRNLGSAVDLSQLITLFWGSFQRRFLSPTPREQIELSAPQPFVYANYYNYFLFYTAVTLCFGCLQPLVLPITALYFWMDSFSKKYILLYIFITKYESGGMFWRSLFNRILVATMLSNMVVALLVTVKSVSWVMAATMGPLPFLLIAFKFYCVKTFDDPIHYYDCSVEHSAAAANGKERHRDRVGVRFGNPLLYKPLMTPMVAAKSQHMLKQVYSGRTSFDETRTLAGYSDVYMDPMDRGQPGKPSGSADAPFAFVSDNQLDYEHWKNDAQFAGHGGGEGELFGHSADMIRRPGTPSSFGTADGGPQPARSRTWESDYSHSRVRSDDSDIAFARGVPDDDDHDAPGVAYPRGYHVTPGMREHSPAGSDVSYGGHARNGSFGAPLGRNASNEGLVAHAAGMGRSPPPMPQQQQQYQPYQPQLGVPAPGGYGLIRMTPGEESMGTPGEGDVETSYDYFRRGRVR